MPDGALVSYLLFRKRNALNGPIMVVLMVVVPTFSEATCVLGGCSFFRVLTAQGFFLEIL